jgi:hypothetical protein
MPGDGPAEVRTLWSRECSPPALVLAASVHNAWLTSSRSKRAVERAGLGTEAHVNFGLPFIPSAIQFNPVLRADAM